jgi:hypothetical protein
VAKRQALETYIADGGLEWDDDALHSVDMEYHNVDPREGLYYALERMGRMKRVCSERQILDAMTEPPADTRAAGRSLLVHSILETKTAPYWIDWDMVALERGIQFAMRDPFHAYTKEAASFSHRLPGPRRKR